MGAREACCLAVVASFAAPRSGAQVLSQTTVAGVGGANALSTPAARHLVRMDSGTYLLALQRDTALPETGLNLYRSDDDGFSWRPYAPINPSALERHTADLIKVGDDLAMVTSFDAPSIAPDPALDPGRKVYFQWWRKNGPRDWVAQPRVTVLAPPAGAAYHRGEVAVDSGGRIWVQAFKRGASSCDPATNSKCAVCAEVANGDNFGNQVVVSVSADGGRTFSPEQTLATTLCRAGGRLIGFGNKLLLIWNDYSANEHGSRVVTKFVQRRTSDPLGTWSAPKVAFPDDPTDGIYHGAALSAVADASGVHLVYKDQNQQRLWYRRFDAATGTFGAPVQVDDSQQDWALQPATLLRNGELFVAANHRVAEGKYVTRIWRQSVGFGAANASALAPEDAFHGYPTLPETLPASTRIAAYVYARAASVDGPADELSMRVALERPIAVLSLEAGRAVLPAGKSVALRLSTAQVPGLTGPLEVDVSGLPASVHAELDRGQLMPGQETTLTLSAHPAASAMATSSVVTLLGANAEWKIPFELDVFAAPAVSLRGAAQGDILAGVARIEVDAAASPGMKLTEVRLLVDGAPVASAADSRASFSWDTSAVPDGEHDLGAMAFDEIGNASSTPPLRIAVRNRGAGGCTSTGADAAMIAVAAAVALRRRRRGPTRV